MATKAEGKCGFLWIAVTNYIVWVCTCLSMSDKQYLLMYHNLEKPLVYFCCCVDQKWWNDGT